MRRYAIVRDARTLREVEAYLPDNYRVIHKREFVRTDRPQHTVAVEFVIQGEDRAGWTLDGYVIPRLLSGAMGCQEIDLSHPIMKQVPISAVIGT